MELAEQQLAMHEERLIKRALETLKQQYAEKYERYSLDDNYNSEGYLEVLHTQVVYIKDEITVDETFAKSATMFENVDALVEFVVLDDLLGMAPCYHPTYGVVTIRVDMEGALEIISSSLPYRYYSYTYSNDFSGIIESIYDRNSEFNGMWYLLK